MYDKEFGLCIGRQAETEEQMWAGTPQAQTGSCCHRLAGQADLAQGKQLGTQLLLGISFAMKSPVPFKGLSDWVWPTKDNLVV